MTRVARDERGAALVFAIAFMVVIGAISAATLSSITSGLHNRTTLDVVRNRQYAADAGVEQAIAAARGSVASWSATTNAAAPQNRLQTFLNSANCGGSHNYPKLNGVYIQVDCKPAPALHNGYFQFNGIFSAAVCTNSACNATESTAVVRAEINFDISGGTVTRTYVQSWSVNT